MPVIYQIGADMLDLSQAVLSTADHEAYQRDGFVIVRQALSADYIQDCREAAKAWVAATIQIWLDQGLLEHGFNDLGFRERFLRAWQAAGEPAYARSPRAGTIHAAPEHMYRVLHHEQLIDLAEEILATNKIVRHASFNLRPKAPHQRFTDTPWHQDAQYFPKYADANMVNMWFPMHDVDAQSSCLAFAPGVHKQGLFQNDESDINNGFIGLCPEQAREMPCLPAELKVGDVVIFTSKTPHVAMPNHSDLMRWSWDVRFIDYKDADAEVMQLGKLVRHPDKNLQSDYVDFVERWQDMAW